MRATLGWKMNRGFPLLLLGLVLLLASLLVACAPSPTISTPTPTPTTIPTPELETLTYTNSEWGFSVEYPKDWDVEESVEDAIVVFVGPFIEETGVPVNVRIGGGQLPAWAGVTPEIVVSQIKKRLNNAVGNYKEVDGYNTVADDITATVWTLTGDIEGVTLMMTWACFLKDNVAYVVGYTATPESHGDYLHCFELVLSTFEFE